MTSFLIPALVLFAPTTGSGGEDPAPGIDLKNLTQALDMVDSMRVGGLLRASIDSADDDLSTVPGEDIRGVRFEDAQIWFSAQAYGYDMFVRFDAGEATAFPPIDNNDDGVQAFDMRDAWIRKQLTDGLFVYVGQYKCPLVASGNVGDDSLAMIDRTRIGQLFSGPGAFQPGAAIVGDFGRFHAKLAVQNGADVKSDGLGVVARGEVKLGEGAAQREGALGSQGFNATVGVGYFKDSSNIAPGEDFGTGLAVDAYATFNRISLQAEILDTDEDLAKHALANTNGNDATPYDATLGFLLTDKIEAFARYQDLDNEVSASILGAGVNYYVAEHKMKWQLNASQYDDDNIDGLILQLGFSIGQDGQF